MDSSLAESQFSVFLPPPFAIRIGWVCVHSLWQCLLVAAILHVALRLIPRRSTAQINARYLLSVAALVALPLLSATTYFASDAGPITKRHVEQPASATPLTQGVDSTSTSPWGATDGALAIGLGVARVQIARIEPWLPLVSVVWFVGAFLAGLRMVAGWALSRRLVAHAKVATENRWQARVATWCEELGVNKAVRFLVSDAIDSPLVVGWLKPVILWPTAALHGMTPQDVEAIIAHELAHIRRGDVLINLLQACIEVLFFHHPAAWWISAQIRAEREYCADDLAVRMLDRSESGTKLSYARALLALEEHRSIPLLSVAAKGGKLLDRIRRLVGVETTGHSPARPLVGGLVTTSLLGILLAGVFVTSPSRAIGPRSVMIRPAEAVKPEVDADATAEQSRPNLPLDSVIEATLIAEAIINRLTNAGVPPEPLRMMTSELWGAIEGGKPLTLRQVEARLEELGIARQTLLAPPAGMAFDAKTNGVEPIVDPNIVSEPIAMSVTARLANAGVDPQVLTAIHDTMWDAIRAGNPINLEQLHARLESLGVPAEMLHAPPAKLPPGVPPPVIPPLGATNVDPNLVNEPIALAVVARLSKAGVDGKTMSAIRDSMWEAIRAGNPLTLEQLHARLESLGLSAETLHGPPKSGPEDQTGSGPEDQTGSGPADQTGSGPEDQTGSGPEDQTGSGPEEPTAD
jgi:beta-lactamase regulating signal transducer with metallopeptidase domain